MEPSDSAAQLRAAAAKARDRLVDWLLNAAYPFWSTRGVDAVHGGFHEAVSPKGVPLEVPRRGRVQPRQIFAFSKARHFGWQGNAFEAVSHGLTYFLTRYRRTDELFRTLVAPDGSPLDNRAVLYDQAFALLAFATASPLLGPSFDLPGEAEQLRQAVVKHYHRPTGEGFNSRTPPGLPLQSNPHMHLLESSLAWNQATGLPAWSEMAEEIGKLALTKFIDAPTGALRECFDDNWAPAQGVTGRIVEPGHQFEWAFLLMSWKGPWRDDVRQAACKLIDIGEQHGVHNGVAINSLLDDFSIHDGSARLWPQTERLRAAAIAARLIGDTRYWKMVNDAAAGLLRYLDTPVPGIWYDQLLPSGEFGEVPVPAGNLYHIVGAIEEIDTLLKH